MKMPHFESTTGVRGSAGMEEAGRTTGVSAGDPLAADVLIIGGGIIGLSCAYYLQAEGRDVRLIDQGRLGHGSSLSNCGLVTPSHALPLAHPGVIAQTLKWMLHADSPFYFKPRLDPEIARWGFGFFRSCRASAVLLATAAKAALLTYSRELTGDLIRSERLDCDWQEAGLYIVFQSRAAFDAMDPVDALLAEHGITCQKLDGEELVRREPALRAGLAGARFYAVDAHLRPEKLLAEMVRVVRARGATLVEECPASRIVVDGGRITSVDTPRGPIHARDVVLATGAWSASLGGQIGLRLPIQPGKGYTITIDAPASAPRTPLLLSERKVAITPWSGRLRIGGTMEFNGYDTTLNRLRLAALERAAGEYLAAPLPSRGREEWYGWRPMTYDDLPILGRAPGASNLYIAAGHNMLGLSMGAGTGRAIADLVTGRAPAIDLAPFSPGRFR
jgi:D-amino-acid dehydrogenase